MKLNNIERLKLLQLLPKEGNILTLKLVRDLAGQLGFNEDEIQEMGIVVNGPQITWQQDNEKDVKIGPVMKNVIVDILTDIDKNNKATMDMFSLFEKFDILPVEAQEETEITE